MKKLANIFAALSFSILVACAPIEEGDLEQGDDIENVDENQENEVEQDQPTEEEQDEGQVRVAEFDNDSLQDPAVSYFMSPTTTREFFYSDAISFPDGDAADFVELELPNNSNSAQNIEVTLDAAFEGQQDVLVRATLFEDGEQTTRIVQANQGTVSLTVDNTKVQTLRIHFSSVAEPTFVDYTLSVQAYR
ncbi:MAG: hypothetical protein KJO07_01255 [Deltaproteobacteria bacterium]|nr:hypothetical protein [Deltaproteobacteria bacterium]